MPRLSLLLVFFLAGCVDLRPAAPGASASFVPAAAPDTVTLRAAAVVPPVDLAPDVEVAMEEAPLGTLPPDSVLVPAEELEAFLLEARTETIGTGRASYYGHTFAGRRTASGERFDPGALTAAHRSLPFGSRVRVTNLTNGRSVVVRINDRGPFSRRRVIDLSRAAALELGMLEQGVATVRLELLPEETGQPAVRTR